MNISDERNSREVVRELARLEIEGAQQDGMKLGIKHGAVYLRRIADECARDSNVAPDYVRGLRDAAVFIEQFANEAGTK